MEAALTIILTIIASILTGATAGLCVLGIWYRLLPIAVITVYAWVKVMESML